MIKNKCKKIVSAMLIMTMIATTLSVDVFAGGEFSCVKVDNVNCGGVFKDCLEHCCPCIPPQPNYVPINNYEFNNQNYKFNEDTGHLTLLGSYIGTGPIAPQYTNNIRSVTIERGVHRLVGTFQECYNLNSVIMPDTMKKIGENAFAECRELESITIPDSVTEIEARAFKGCTSLESIKIPDSVTKIGEYAFKGCKKLKKVTISNSSTEIDENAFDDCPADIIYPKPSLNPITAPSVTSPMVSYSGINDSVGQTPITLPPNIVVNNSINNAIPITPNQIQAPISTDVKQNMDSNSLEKESIYDNKFGEETGHLIVGKDIENKKLKDIVFDYDAIESVTIKDGVTSISEEAFADCRYLTSVTIPNGVISIGDEAFRECRKLTSINIPDSVTSIGAYAFSGCKGLTSVTIPDSVTSIGAYAFSECPNLKQITIPNSVTSIGDYAFDKCQSLKEVKIPNSVTSIGAYAFADCTDLTSINIPNSVTSIGEGAFYGCTGLTSINIPDSVTSIGEYAFIKCARLKEVTVPNSAEIANNTFDWKYTTVNKK